MTTLVISDLHLGARGGRDLLSRPDPLSALVQALAGVGRLVLLGDTIELRQAPRAVALAAARRPLQEIGRALGPGTRVTLVPGNHDHALLGPWLERRRSSPPPAAPASPLGHQTSVQWRAGEPLERLAAWLAPAELEVFYPGCRLRDDVYALHGHYADRHTTVPMLERLGAGVTAWMAGERPGGPGRAEDYEAALAPVYAWADALAQLGGPNLPGGAHSASAQAWSALAGPGGGRGLRRRALGVALPVAVAALNRAGLGPLRADLSPAGLRRASLLAVAEVLLRLGITAPHVVFGHTHRAGPLPADDQTEWRTVTGTRLVNCGSWVLEPEFVDAEPRRSPYRAGFAIALADTPSTGPPAAPALRNLLDQEVSPGVKQTA
ncbi:MAG: metallophosphoesterase [Solirubrobacteraceae bacterium]